MTGSIKSWDSLRDGPWPTVHTGRELARTEREWLHTNGAGAYAMSTLSLKHTRRYHGILVAAFDPPLDRYIMLSHVETTLEVGKKAYRLSTHQFPGTAPTPGYRMLEQFSVTPIPRWEFRVSEGRFERSLFLVRGQNAVVFSYTWFGRGSVRLLVKPLMPLRPIHSLTREHGAMMQVVSLRPGVVEMQPRLDLPPLLFGHEGVFVGSPDWWRRFEYLSDVGHFDAIEEDLWTPGVFELILEPKRTMRLVAAVGQLPTKPLTLLEKETIAELYSADPGPDVRPAERALAVAAHAFRCSALSRGSGDCDGRAAVLAGYPWYDATTRDALMALPGLYLTGATQLREAKNVLRTLLSCQHAGFLPVTLPGSSGPRGERCPDASLWLFHAAAELIGHLGPDDAFVRQELFPSLVRVFLRVRGRHRNLLWLSDDGLVANGARDRPLTWMNATFGEEIFTPRRGLAIEHQALWFKGTRLLVELSLRFNQPNLARAAAHSAERLKASFVRRFWCSEQEFSFDCMSELSGTPETWADKSIRPNAVIALAIAPLLFEPWQAEAILRRARAELLTARGLRTLAPSDPRYVGQFLGDLERRSSMHQGSAWPFLLGFYAEAVRRAIPDDEEPALELDTLLEGVADDGLALGHVAELASGDAPSRAQGCPAHALGVAMLRSALTRETWTEPRATDVTGEG